MLFVPMSYFYSEPNEWSKYGAKLWARLWQATISRQFYRNFHFAWKKKWLVAAQNLQSIKSLLTLELSRHSKSGSMFSTSEPVTARSDCSRIGNALCLCSPVRPAQAVPERGLKSLAIDFALKIFDCLLKWPSGEIARCKGSNLDSNLNTAAWITGCKSFICSDVPK